MIEIMTKQKHIPYGETRIVKRFCLLPRKIYGKIYWMQNIYIKEIWTTYGYDDEWWEPISLSDEDEYTEYRKSINKNDLP